jgi:hypothetical protein
MRAGEMSLRRHQSREVIAIVVTRRELIKGGAAAGALLLSRPVGVLAAGLGPTDEFSTSRASRLFSGSWLAHADLHNHTLFSDGAGDPAAAFDSMRSAGLDAAALTDHATVSYGLPVSICPDSACQALAGIDESSWRRSLELADGAQQDGSFTAMRGFEWSSPTLGHINVWLSERWTDPLHTGGTTTGEGAAQFIHDEMGVPAESTKELDDLVRSAPTTGAGMVAFYDWLRSPIDRPLVGGGIDGIAGFNHPGREPGRFSYFSFHPDLNERIVSIEVFNRKEDYIFEGTTSGARSPINECLNAGWKVGLLGVTDEHGTDWGYPDGKGRTGLWLKSLTRAGVREAMLARRFFSTRLRGLRLDASANGVRMGQALKHSRGAVTFRIDVDRRREWWGKPLNVQVLMAGDVMPTVVHSQDIRVPSRRQRVPSFTCNIDAEDGRWIALRITDPSEPADDRADSTWASFGNAVAYASPFFLTP